MEGPWGVRKLECPLLPLRPVADDADLPRRVAVEPDLGRGQDLRPALARQQGEVKLPAVDVGLGQAGPSQRLAAGFHLREEPLPVRPEKDRILVEADGGMLPDRLDEPRPFDPQFLMHWGHLAARCPLSREPCGRREAGGGEPPLRDELVGREEHRLHPRAGVRDLQRVEEGGNEMDQAPLSDNRFYKVEDHCGPQLRERLRGRREVQRDRDGNGLVAQGGKALGDKSRLCEDILFVPARPCTHLSVGDGNSHVLFPMRFRAERMIPAISSR